MDNRRIKVMVVDDSAVVRQAMHEILTSDPVIGEVACCSDPFAAAAKMQTFVPDVIILDIEMPKMDGLSFLKKIMNQHPIPVVMCSSLADSSSESGLRALEYGAIEIICKPKDGHEGVYRRVKDSHHRYGEGSRKGADSKGEPEKI